MFTDWVLIARAAEELADLLVGSRVREVGQLGDGRFAIVLWKAGSERCLAVDVFAPTPVASLETDLPVLQADPGFIRAFAATLTGMVLLAVESRVGERLIQAEFASRSRFGVEGRASLILELIPRFGNIVLLKDRTIVAALKEFSFAQNASRQIVVGRPYELPPINLHATGDAERLGAALQTDPKSAARELRLLQPLLPPVVAESLVFGLGHAGQVPADTAALIAEADETMSKLSTDFRHGPLVVYRRDGKLAQAHVVPLRQFEELSKTTVPRLLPLFAELRASRAAVPGENAGERRRAGLTNVLHSRERKLTEELKKISDQIAATAEREQLRAAGEEIFSTLHQLPQSQHAQAKERAAENFGRYKKLRSSLPHLKDRLHALRQSLQAVAELQWELERSTAAEIDDVADAVAALEPRKRRPTERIKRRKRKPFAVTTSSGSRIFVGRSPRENAELTFAVARPDDLWFHAQKMPGAHVILQRDDKQKPSEQDLQRAASLAAYYSKGKQNPKVTVDYTQRKYVRKQPAAPPGLVFFTNGRSLTVTPSLDPHATS